LFRCCRVPKALFPECRQEISRGTLISGIEGADSDEHGSGAGGTTGTVEGISDTISEVAVTGSLHEAFSCWEKEFPA
jgi:hypothetical protein